MTPDPTDRLQIRLVAQGVASALGHGRMAHAAAMAAGRSGLVPATGWDLPFACHIGAVSGLETCAPPPELSAYDNRATRLAVAGLSADGFAGRVAEARSRWGAQRVGLVMGTSTSGVEKLETTYRARAGDGPLDPAYSLRHHNDHQAVAAFCQAYLGLEGPCYTISTACSSSAKALVDGVQLIEAGICDAVVVGGVDSLCLTSLNGFEALQLVSREPCRPCDGARDGLSIGEAGAFLLIERGAEGARLSGFGESSDGINMSTPPEDGAGAAHAMREALGALPPDQVAWVNLHGTATPTNDVAEGRAVAGVLGREVPAVSLKGAVGHTLGAAGALEAAMCLIALEEGLVPATVGCAAPDPEIPCAVALTPSRSRGRHILSNAFGFGGNNCALVLSR
ncbi:MAG: beta-ketoacyl-ACP synthase [Pseudomonadota bacterium]